MAKRRGKGIPCVALALPVGVTQATLDNIDKARNRYMAHMLQFDKSAEWIIERLFAPGVLDACRSGFEFSAENHKWASSQNSYIICEGVTIRLPMVRWTTLGMLAPDPKYCLLDTVPDLVKFCEEVKVILEQFAKVTHVLKWFNEANASASALRHYCPWVQSLIPGHQHKYLDGERFKEPNGLGPMLPIIREATTTMATALLIQHDPPVHEVHGFTLIFIPKARLLAIGMVLEIPIYTLAL